MDLMRNEDALPEVRLSLCMTTFKRADYIAETLDSIVDQLVPGVELVVVDGCSPDNTSEVMSRFLSQDSNVRYFREGSNSGVDADFDKAVSYARGEYCWLLADDDLMKPGAIRTVLDALATDKPDLLIVDAEVRDLDMATLLEPRRLSFSGVRRYGPGDTDRFLTETGSALTFIGCVVMQRRLWLSRVRSAYYGSLFVHVGVIFQAPIDAITVVAEPLVSIRLGNCMWSPRTFEIIMFKWPDLVWSFAGVRDEAKASVTPRDPWRSLWLLFGFRANGAYAIDQYRTFFADRPVGAWRMVLLATAVFPGRLANFIAIAYLGLRGSARGGGLYDLTAGSPFSTRLGRMLAARISKPGSASA